MSSHARRIALGLAVVTGPVPLTSTAAAVLARPAASVDAAPILREQIVAAFGRGHDPHLEATAKAPAEARDLIRDRVDRRLLVGATAVTGRDFLFVARDGGRRSIGLLALRFPTAAIAAERARALAGPNRNFAHAEILTPMIVTASGSQVTVLFTESAGDPAVLSVLTTTAARLMR